MNRATGGHAAMSRPATEDGAARGEHHPVDAYGQCPGEPAFAGEGGEGVLMLVGGGGGNDGNGHDDERVQALRPAAVHRLVRSPLAAEACVIRRAAAVVAVRPAGAALSAYFGDAVLR